MATEIRLEPLDHRSVSTARQIHSVQVLAYKQEAQLLGADRFPPLMRSVEDVRTSRESFLGAFVRGKLVGAVSVEPDEKSAALRIASLVVAPKWQKRGVGTRLIEAVLAEYGTQDLTVQTGVKNLAALHLYSRAGFAEICRWFVGREPLELIKLRRPAKGVQHVA
jgi:ribosomal protein S18 acetylase RimI-like enzyme